MADYNEALPDNTVDTEAGIIVKLPDKWATQTTSTGAEITEVTKKATVYAVAIGGGESIPVPYGFYYVGGNLSNGVIISDKKEDKYKYNAVTKKYDLDVDKTTWAYANGFILDEEGKVIGTNGPKLKGNQFVWIPCTTGEYTKSNTWNGETQTNSKLANTWWDTTTPESELTQIEKYGGFYVGRYEAGLASTINEFTTNQTHTGSNQVYNQDGVPQSKAGLVPWNFIDWTHSKANAESMYNNNSYVRSGLITGTEWDTILNKMVSKSAISASDLTDSNSWGNYKNKQLTYTGRKAVASHNGSNYILAPFGSQTAGGTNGAYTGNDGELLTTGASEVTQKYHIFDIAGNLWEWTEETSFYGGNTSSQYRVIRGGGYIDTSSGRPACYRFCNPVGWSSFGIGFRAVLYIK